MLRILPITLWSAMLRHPCQGWAATVLPGFGGFSAPTGFFAPTTDGLTIGRSIGGSEIGGKQGPAGLEGKGSHDLGWIHTDRLDFVNRIQSIGRIDGLKGIAMRYLVSFEPKITSGRCRRQPALT